MAEKNPTDYGECSPRTDDAEAEFIVLSFLIDEHPSRLKIFEASRALNAASDAFGPRDAVERAIVALDGAGLLHCGGGFAVPTRAALYSARLWDTYGV